MHRTTCPAPPLPDPAGMGGEAGFHRPNVLASRFGTWISAHRRLVHCLRVLLALAVIVYLAQSVARIGWSDVWAALPSDPWFYLLFAVIHLIPPLSEVAIFQRLWRSGWALLPALLHKRVLNDAVLDYTGDAFLALWARARIVARGSRSCRR